jgi:poly(A) polymerase
LSVHSATSVVSLDHAATLFLRRLVSLVPGDMEPHIVGGFLRDALLGRATRDLDLTVSGDALALARHFADALDGAYVPLDESRNIARVVANHENETWRIDVAALQGDRLQDLARRDFTIDAMSVSLDDMLEDTWPFLVQDPFDGRDDLERRQVCVVSPGVFLEDGIRLLRAVRLAAQLDFAIGPEVRELIQRDASALEGVAGERIRDELMAILASRSALSFVHLLNELGLLTRVFPDLEAGRDVQQPKEHYWDVLTHNIETVGAVEGLLARDLEPAWVLEMVPWPADMEAYFKEMMTDGHTRGTLLKLAGLLHDVAKPATRTETPEGKIRFLGHHTDGADMAGKALERLRFSNKGITLVRTQVEHHLRPALMSHGDDLATTRAVFRYFRSAGDAAVDTLYLNLADYLAARGPFLEKDEWAAYTKKVCHILESGVGQQGKAPSMPRLVDGNALMAELALLPGPLVGQLLDAIQESQATGEVNTRDAAIALARCIIASQGKESGHA